MVRVRRRDTEWPIKVPRRIILRNRFGMLNAPFNVADRIQILINTIAIARSQRILEASEFFDNRIEKTRSIPKRSAALTGGAFFAEEILEYDPRVSFRR